jgi:hypothetical protein
MNRIRTAACAAILCALVAAAPPAAAETGDSSPIRPVSDGGLSLPVIAGPEEPEEFPLQWGPLSPALKLRQVSDQEIVAEYFEYGLVSYSIHAPGAHDADGATVPTTIALTEDEKGPVVTIVVHHRAGNPAAGFAPFAYPITDGPGWEGGFRTTSFEMNEPRPPASEPAPAPSPPAPTCTVPSLRGFGLAAVKKLLRGADCGIGQVRLARGATKGKGKVVKQFKLAGTQLAAGAPVAVKLRSR